MSDLEIILQMVSDNEKTTKRPMIDWVLLKRSITEFDNEPREGLYAIQFNMSSNGGSISVYKIVGLGEKKDGRRKGTFSSYQYILIEAKDAGSITQPYNRQFPFYVPISYQNLGAPEEHGEFLIYRSKEFPCNLWSSVDEDRFNEYWNTYTHVVCVAPEDVDKVLELIINISLKGGEQ